MIKSAFVKVRGMVQGVGFRYSGLNKARSLGLRGWIKNEHDGSVVSRFEGDPFQVDSFIHWLKRGPSSAMVKSFEIKELEEDPQLSAFRVEY